MITLLEMHERPVLAYTRPQHSGMLLRLDEPSVEFYRFLHRSAGSRRSAGRAAELSDEAVFEHLVAPAVEVFVLFLGGSPAGFFEIDRAHETDVELVHVGLLPAFHGRGLGRYLVASAVETAWDDEPDRVWTSATADEDPRALLLYQWAGFVAFDARAEEPTD